MGEGWHNNHHTWPRSAKLGVAPGELDPGWLFVRLLERAGLATDVLVAGEATRTPRARALT